MVMWQHWADGTRNPARFTGRWQILTGPGRIQSLRVSGMYLTIDLFARPCGSVPDSGLPST